MNLNAGVEVREGRLVNLNAGVEVREGLLPLQRHPVRRLRPPLARIRVELQRHASTVGREGEPVPPHLLHPAGEAPSLPRLGAVERELPALDLPRDLRVGALAAASLWQAARSAGAAQRRASWRGRFILRGVSQAPAAAKSAAAPSPLTPPPRTAHSRGPPDGSGQRGSAARRHDALQQVDAGAPHRHGRHGGGVRRDPQDRAAGGHQDPPRRRRRRPGPARPLRAGGARGQPLRPPRRGRGARHRRRRGRLALPGDGAAGGALARRARPDSPAASSWASCCA